MSIIHRFARGLRSALPSVRTQRTLVAVATVGLGLVVAPPVARSMSIVDQHRALPSDAQPRPTTTTDTLVATPPPVEATEHVHTDIRPHGIAAPPTCTVPEPSARWEDRRDDDDWAEGLYPTREDYPQGWMALTFDDGPHRTRTPQVLDLLAEKDLHATFFLTGFAIRASTYHLVRRMVDEGHTVANHGWRHDVGMTKNRGSVEQLEDYLTAELELTQIRVDLAMMANDAEDFATMDRRVFESLRRWDERGDELTAMPALRERHRALLAERGFSPEARPLQLTWMRPPGGIPYMGRRTNEEREAFARVVGRLGLKVVMWNGGTGDSSPHLDPAKRMDPTRIGKSARKAARRGGIYVAHDRIKTPALRAMITALVRSDAQLVSLAQLQHAKQQANGWCGATTVEDPRLAVATPTSLR